MKKLVWLSWPVLCLPLMAGPALAAGEAASVNAPPTETAKVNPIDAQALDVLTRMAETLAGAGGFRVTIRSDYDVVQDSGEKITFGERRTVTLKRPDGLRIDAEQSDGKRTQVSFDGKALTVFSPDDNVYGRIERPGDVNEAVRYAVQDLQVRLPLALLLVTSLPAELTQRLQALDYVERDTLTAVPTDHLAGQTDGVDFQVWIPTEGNLLPQRVTITYKNDEGEPQFRADLTGWALNPEVNAAQLAFELPQGAERIPFVVRTRRTIDHQPTIGTGSSGSTGSGDTEGASK